MLGFHTANVKNLTEDDNAYMLQSAYVKMT